MMVRYNPRESARIVKRFQARTLSGLTGLSDLLHHGVRGLNVDRSRTAVFTTSSSPQIIIHISYMYFYRSTYVRVQEYHTYTPYQQYIIHIISIVSYLLEYHTNFSVIFYQPTLVPT